MSLVLLFGSFDILHDGHRDLFRQAKELGKSLHIILARDETIQVVKKRAPYYGAEVRKHHLEMEPLVDMVHMGSLGDKYALAQRLEPDVILLGYDQEAFIPGLFEEITTWSKVPRIERALPYKEGFCKSSLLRAAMETEE